MNVDFGMNLSSKPLPEPRPHQVEAIKDVLTGFQRSDRGQLIMPCATGKTLTCMWVKEELQAKRTLVLVPSLNLLSQLLNDYVFASQRPFDALCVCSDQTVTTRNEDDEPVTRIEDLSLPFPVSNNASVVADFLKKDTDKEKIIFCTYHSSPLIADAQKDATVPYFDLAIADEAQRCCGKVDSAFATILSDRIRSHRRLFTTATPRIFTRSARKTAEVHGYEVIDMNDEKGFGPQFYNLPFSKAIEDKLLTDYRVVIARITHRRIKEIKSWIEKRQLMETDTGLLTDARSLAVCIAVLSAIDGYNNEPQNGYRLISFHGRVRKAQEFSEDFLQVAKWLHNSDKPRGKFWAHHVSGEMPMDFRTEMLKRLKNVGAGEIGLLSNARCLGEGVDVPALDAIVFADSKKSEIDIIQSVGRAIRLSQNKTMGTVILPVFIDETDSAEEALASSEFKTIWDVMQALRSHDDRLGRVLDNFRIAQGSTGKRITANDLKNINIHFDSPTFVDEDFAQAFGTHLVENNTEPWLSSYGRLQAYVQEHGNCHVPQSYKTNDGFALGTWVGWQRYNKDTMNDERRQYLGSVPGWSWDSLSDWWEDGFAHLKEYAEREGDCRVPYDHETNDGYRLGQWVVVQRAARTKKSRMTPERRQRLESLPKWSWRVTSDWWEEGFAYLKAYAKEHGDCRVSYNLKTDNGYNLGQWVVVQGTNKDTMDDERRKRLESLPRWSWSAQDDQWEEEFAHLKAFAEQNDHCRVPQDYNNGFNLGAWVRRQRGNKSTMKSDRGQRLEELPGWLWNGRLDHWEDIFIHLKKFAESNGHCRVPSTHKTDDGYNVITWIKNQQKRKDKLNADRQQRLEALPGWSWGKKKMEI